MWWNVCFEPNWLYHKVILMQQYTLEKRCWTSIRLNPNECQHSLEKMTKTWQKASSEGKSERWNWIKQTLHVGKASICTSSRQRAQENKNGWMCPRGHSTGRIYQDLCLHRWASIQPCGWQRERQPGMGECDKSQTEIETRTEGLRKEKSGAVATTNARVMVKQTGSSFFVPPYWCPHGSQSGN